MLMLTVDKYTHALSTSYLLCYTIQKNYYKQYLYCILFLYFNTKFQGCKMMYFAVEKANYR